MFGEQGRDLLKRTERNMQPQPPFSPTTTGRPSVVTALSAAEAPSKKKEAKSRKWRKRGWVIDGKSETRVASFLSSLFPSFPTLLVVSLSLVPYLSPLDFRAPLYFTRRISWADFPKGGSATPEYTGLWEAAWDCSFTLKEHQKEVSWLEKEKKISRDSKTSHFIPTRSPLPL